MADGSPGPQVSSAAAAAAHHPFNYLRVPAIRPATNETRVMMIAAKTAVQKKESMVKFTGV